MLVTTVSVPIDFHCIFSPGSQWEPKISSFMFHWKQKVVQVWNDIHEAERILTDFILDYTFDVYTITSVDC